MDSTDLVLSGNGLSQSLERISRPMQRQARREIERVVVQGLVKDLREQVRAHLTNTSLQNTGALSELEGYLRQIAPTGAARYQHIVDAYALGAAQTIARW
ncbi:MAG: phosphoenolpyruvate carboxylase [Actinobacteria bacterium]|nr:phosphoenolpyruvate carboxylase [Actinomycetota bacterium]